MIIKTQPQAGFTIISQGEGNVHTPSGLPNYNGVNWALATNGTAQVLFVWSADGSKLDNSSGDMGFVFFVVVCIAFFLLLCVVFAVLQG